MPKLSPKHRRFVTEYLKDQNATQAAIRSGYGAKNADVVGPRLLGYVGIRESIDEALQDAAKVAGVSAVYIISSLKEIVERCMERVRVMEFDREEKTMVQKLDADGLGVWEFDSGGANKALELLGRNLKLWTDKQEHSGSVSFGAVAKAVRNGQVE